MRRGEWNLQSDDLLDDPEYGVKRGPLARVPYANQFAPRTQWIALGSLVVLLLLFLLIIITSVARTHTNDNGTYKNVIFMISDGYGPASQVMARVTNAVETTLNYDPLHPTIKTNPLPLDEYLVGTARTYSSDSWVTDSAAGATAYSCALKTYNNAIGVDENKQPCGNLFEAGRSKGMATGIVVTSSFSHATPASFSSHSIHRDAEDFIASQQMKAGLDVMFGGGSRYWNERKDGRNLFEEAKKDPYSYTVTSNLSEWEQVNRVPVLSLFTRGQMSYDIDRDAKVEPSLSEMVSKAIHLLSNKPNNRGFMLLVEGSRIDHAGHSNDAPSHYRDIMAYQEAVKTVMEFAKKDGNTIVVSVSDHETGGLTLGQVKYYEWKPELLLQAKASSYIIASKMREKNETRSIFKQYYNMDLTDAEEFKINSTFSMKLDDTIIQVGHVFSDRARLGWTTLAHTGVDVNLYAYGPNTEKLRGNLENIEVGKFVESTLGLNLENETKRLKSNDVDPVPRK